MHELELERARSAARASPASIDMQYTEVRALSELEHPDLDARLAEILGSAESPYSSGQALCIAASESRGHGHAGTGANLLDRCIAWDVDRLEVGRDPVRLRLGLSLITAGRLAEARVHLERLAETRPDHPNVIGPLAVIEAAEGNMAEAERIAASMQGQEPGPPGLEYRKLYWQAAIAAHLGWQKEAVRLLQQLAEAGGTKPDRHDPFLEPIWDYAPFEQLLEVTG